MFLNYVIVALVVAIIVLIIIYFFFIRFFKKEFSGDRVVYYAEKQLGLEETIREDDVIEEKKENCESNLIIKKEE